MSSFSSFSFSHSPPLTPPPPPPPPLPSSPPPPLLLSGGARYLGFVPAGDNLVFIVLELCDARTLHGLVRGSILTAEFRRDICRQIVCGLAYVGGGVFITTSDDDDPVVFRLRTGRQAGRQAQARTTVPSTRSRVLADPLTYSGTRTYARKTQPTNYLKCWQIRAQQARRTPGPEAEQHFDEGQPGKDRRLWRGKADAAV